MELLMDGFKLLVIGMGWVFVFLSIMIAVISLVSRMVAPFSHLLENEPDRRRTVKSPSKTGGDDTAMVAAAAAAVQLHRARK